MRPGRKHDTSCFRVHPGLRAALADWTGEHHVVLADLGYERADPILITPVKKTRAQTLSVDQRLVNALHSATRTPAERGNALLKTTFKAIRRISLCSWRIGASTAAALVLLHQEHDRTT